MTLGGYTLAAFTADRTASENAIIALQPADDTRSKTFDRETNATV